MLCPSPLGNTIRVVLLGEIMSPSSILTKNSHTFFNMVLRRVEVPFNPIVSKCLNNIDIGTTAR